MAHESDLFISGKGWLITEHVGRIVAYSMQWRQVMDHAGVDGFKGYLILCRFPTFFIAQLTERTRNTGSQCYFVQ